MGEPLPGLQAMRFVTNEEVRRAIEERGCKALRVWSCDVCGVPLYYLFEEDGAVRFDARCACSNMRGGAEARPYMTFADVFNWRDPETRERWWREMTGEGGAR